MLLFGVYMHYNEWWLNNWRKRSKRYVTRPFRFLDQLRNYYYFFLIHCLLEVKLVFDEWNEMKWKQFVVVNPDCWTLLYRYISVIKLLWSACVRSVWEMRVQYWPVFIYKCGIKPQDFGSLCNIIVVERALLGDYFRCLKVACTTLENCP